MNRQATAVRHLQLLRTERNPTQDALYVRLAFTYGVQVDQIATESGLTIQQVRDILGGK